MSTYNQAVAPLEPPEAGIDHLRGPDGAAAAAEAAANQGHFWDMPSATRPYAYPKLYVSAQPSP